MDFNSHHTYDQAASDAINEAIDDGLRRKRDNQPRRDYLGASSVGHDCERQLEFELAGALKERDFEAPTLRKFDIGHTLEELARGWLIDAGFDLLQWTKKGEPIRFVQLNGRFKGHVDGVVFNGPSIPGLVYPALWEHKGVGNKTYSGIKRSGLKKNSPGYYAQIQIYMGYLDLGQTLFTVTAAEDGEQQHLIIPYDPDAAQQYSDRAVRVIKSVDSAILLPRPYKDPSNYHCVGCFYRERCWRLS